MRPQLLPASTSGVGEPGRRGVRILAAVALVLGYSAATACSDDSPAPVAPSPGLGASQAPVTPRSTTPGPASTKPGPGAAKPGIDLTVAPRRDGSFDVVENVLLPKAVGMLPLRLPVSGAHLPGMMAPTTPQVTNLKVVADNQDVPLESTSVTGASNLPLTVAATRIQLTYRLLGSTVFATPSKSSRAGAAIRPLTAGLDATLPTDITVTSGLLNAVCPLLTETRCAVGDPPRLTIQTAIPAGKALVVLQLDLPR